MLSRRQPPAYSPLGLGSVAAAVPIAARMLRDPRGRLASMLRDRFAADEVVLCGSGTEALTLALSLAERATFGTNSVALPGFSCFDVASAAVAAGVKVCFYDIEPSTLGPDFDSLSRCLDSGARAVVIAPLYGVPLDYDAVADCLGAHDAVVIEDAAQGQGAEWKDRPLGSIWPISLLSFGRGKGWTGGGGGALLLRKATVERPTIAAESDWQVELKTLVAAGAQWALGRPRLYGLPAGMPWLRLGETVYREPIPPRAMPRASASMIVGTLERADREALARRRHAELLARGLKYGPRLRPIRVPAGGTAGYLRFPVRVVGGVESLGQRLAELGAAASYPSTLEGLGPIQGSVVSGGPLPGAEELARELVTFPTHSLLTEGERRELLRLANKP